MMIKIMLPNGRSNLRCVTVVSVASVAHVGEHFGAEAVESSAPGKCSIDADNESQNG